MVATERKPFVANAAFIAAEFLPDRKGDCVDPNDAVLLMCEDETSPTDVYTKDEWENDKEPSYRYEEHEWRTADGEPIPESVGVIEFMPDMCFVKIDETQYWEDDTVKAMTKRVYGVYVLDRRKHVHCCEITPSYELYRLGSQYDYADPDISDDDREKLFEAILEGDATDERWSYVHVSDIDKILKNECKTGWLPDEGKNGGNTIDTGMVRTEDAIEYLQEYYCRQEF